MTTTAPAPPPTGITPGAEAASTARRPVPRLGAAIAGAAAAALALGTGELLSGAADAVPSLVVAVADVLVDDAPGGVVRWSIDTLGTSQKTLLVNGVVVVALAVGALLGALATRRFAAAAGGFAAFAVLGGWAAARQPESSDVASWYVAALSAAAGIAALVSLLRTLHPRVAPPPRRMFGASARIPRHEAGGMTVAGGATVGASGHEAGGMTVAGGATVGASGHEATGQAPRDRRWFLLASGATAGLALAGAGVGRRLRHSAAVDAARTDIAGRLGGAPPTVPPGVTAFDGDVAGISPLITPNRDFYRIDTALSVPRVDPADWALRVTGMVDRPFALTFDELLGMERLDEFITLSCVSNEVGGELVGNALWAGVPLATLLERAGVQPGATQLVGRSVDGWTAGFPTEVAVDGRPAMVAIAMNGEPLPIRHGFPARLVVPGLYGYVSATKWLAEIELTTWEAFDAYWVPRGWAKEGPIKTQSRIDVPRHGMRLAAGRTAVAGVAWAPLRRIARVEVRVDEGAWEPARLSGELSDAAWVQWWYDWQASPGRHRLEVRATDGTGATQTAERARPAPDGATGHHYVTVDIT